MIHPEFSLSYRKQKLYIEKVSVHELVKKHGTPLYVYSKKAITHSYLEFKKATQSLPVHIHYAVKANSNLSLLKIFKNLGAGCDLVSLGEWYRAQEAGFKPSSLILSGVAKSEEELRTLFQQKGRAVDSIHIESLDEFYKIVELAQAYQKETRIAFRFNPSVDAHTHRYISTGRKHDKFGLHEREILSAVYFLKTQPQKFVRLVGLSIHIGSQILTLQPFEKAFIKLMKLVDQVEAQLQKKLEYVDLGGGIGVQYHQERPISLNQYVRLIQKTIGTERKIYLELGRSLIANAGILLTQTIASKVRGQQRILILDAAMNDLMRPALYGAYHKIIPAYLSTAQEQWSQKKWDIVGGVCESTDYFARARPLAVSGSAQETLAILSAGAYGFSMSSTYNSRPRPAEVLVDGARAALIRKRETYDDLIRQELKNGPTSRKYRRKNS